MKRASFTRRIEIPNKRLLPSDRHGMTHEELCRSIWKSEPEEFRALAEESSLSYFLPRF